MKQMSDINASLYASPLSMFFALREALDNGTTYLPAKVKCGKSTFTLTDENFNAVRLGCLMASSWGEES